MKHLLSGILCLATVFAVHADYRIVYLNQSPIVINGKSLKLGDTFAGQSRTDIRWNSQRQAMKVVDTDTGIQSLIVAEKYGKSKAKNLGEFIAQTRHLSARDGAPDNVVALNTLLSDRFYFTDSLTIATGFETDKDRFFYISYRYGGEDINKMIPNDNGAFTITGDIFTIDGKSIPPFETTLAVYYLDQLAGKVTLVTDQMWISLLNDTDSE